VGPVARFVILVDSPQPAKSQGSATCSSSVIEDLDEVGGANRTIYVVERLGGVLLGGWRCWTSSEHREA
jgi:hypothetical protein